MTELTLNDTLLGQLRAPVRNRYFYGKLLDVRHLELEQAYDLTQRWLVNRLGLGAGVLCGLELALGDSGVVVRPGVAVDGLGREIVVPAAYCIADPAQPTDDDGRPSGDKVADGTVTIYLCYTECPDDPTPVLVGDCDSRNGFAPGSTVARYKIVLRAGLPASPPGLSADQCAGIFPVPIPADPDLRLAACSALDAPCGPPDEACVVLGVVSIGSDGVPHAVDACRPRTTIYSNSRIFDMLACLADAFARCCATAELQYVAGDAQQGLPGEALAAQLQVKVHDHLGSPRDDVEVTFHVQAGGGQVSDGTTTADRVVVTSAGGGLAAVTLTLGGSPGPASVEATIDTGSRVVFSAWATEPTEPATPPVVRRLRPAPAQVIRVDDDADGTAWAKAPSLTVAFDQVLDQAAVEKPDDWLRCWLLRSPGGDDESVALVRAPLTFSRSGGDGEFVAEYALELDVAQAVQGAGVVQIRAEGSSIVSAGSPPVLLDADFAGTQVPDELLDKLWEVDGQASLPRALWDGLVDTGASLPQSGDGVAGGRFHSWFGLVSGQ